MTFYSQVTLSGMSYMEVWFQHILTYICEFLLSEPICYLFGMVLLMFVLNFLKALFNITK